MMNNSRLPMMGGGLAGMPPSGGGPPGVGGVPSVGMAALLPRKVLINPNFKGGGVEAATSELHSFEYSGTPCLLFKSLLDQYKLNLNRLSMEIKLTTPFSSPPLQTN